MEKGGGIFGQTVDYCIWNAGVDSVFGLLAFGMAKRGS